MSESRDHEISIAQSPAKCAYHSRHDKDVEHAVQRGDQQDRCGDIMTRCGGALAQFCDTKMPTSEPLTAIGRSELCAQWCASGGGDQPLCKRRLPLAAPAYQY